MMKLRRIRPRGQCSGVEKMKLLQLLSAFLRLRFPRFRCGGSIACETIVNGHGVVKDVILLAMKRDNDDIVMLLCHVTRTPKQEKSPEKNM